jgi:alkylhydroperoxidase family enzyme
MPTVTLHAMASDTLNLHRAAITRAVHETPGDLTAQQRSTIFDAARAVVQARTEPDALHAFVQKVIHSAYKTTDRDVAELLALGFTEDAIYEAIVTAAAGAGMRRIDSGLRAMRTNTP